LTTTVASERRREHPPRRVNTVGPDGAPSRRCNRLVVDLPGGEATPPPDRGNDYRYEAACLAGHIQVVRAAVPAVLSTQELK
jgi:hypothetical protein